MGTLDNTLNTIGSVGGMIPGYGSLIGLGTSVVSGIAGTIKQQQLIKDMRERKEESDQIANSNLEQVSINNAMQVGQSYTPNVNFTNMYAFGNTAIAPLNESPERVGNETIPLSSTGELVVGPSHAQGGVDIPGSDAEVEGGEVLDNGMVFSDRLMASETKTFADIAKEFELEKADNEKIIVDTIDKYLVDTLERKNEIIDVKLAKLFEAQGVAKQQAEQQMMQ